MNIVDEIEERQTLGAYLARGQVLLMRAAKAGLTDARSQDGNDLRCSLVKILRGSSVKLRSRVVNGLEQCIAWLELRCRTEKDAVTSRRLEIALYEVLTQAEALTTQLETIAILAHSPQQHAA